MLDVAGTVLRWRGSVLSGAIFECLYCLVLLVILPLSIISSHGSILITQLKSVQQSEPPSAVCVGIALAVLKYFHN